MSKRLEDFIKNNKEEFDELEPRASLWYEIEQNLPQQFAEKKREAKTFSLSFVLRVAAIVIMVMGACFFVYVHNEKKDVANTIAAVNPEYVKQQMHYTSLIATQRTELKTIARSAPQLYKEFTAEIAKMDSTYKKLNHELATSPNQEAVLRAMIRNLQMQTEVLTQQLSVIEQFNDFKKQKNEIKNI